MKIEDAWKSKNFEVIWTEDGSPSLKPSQGMEMMHHRGGAYAETQLIYGEVIRETLSKGAARFISVGLGLGYNELVIADEVLRLCHEQPDGETSSRFADSLHILSFESNPILINEFVKFLKSEKLEDPAHEVYAQILDRLEFKKQIPQFLIEQLQAGSWKVYGALSMQVNFAQKYQCILFDAFSSKTSPDLWTEDFLKNFFSVACDENCIFSTYACTGGLKRSLKESGFQVTLREGFHGKRNSTLAKRGNYL